MRLRASWWYELSPHCWESHCPWLRHLLAAALYFAPWEWNALTSRCGQSTLRCSHLACCRSRVVQSTAARCAAA